MISIQNYRDLQPKVREKVVGELFQLGFCPAFGGQKTVQRELEHSPGGALPQYIFAFRGGELVGYLFLIGEREGASRVFPWWSVGNADELPMAEAEELLTYGLRLAEGLRRNLEQQKKGLGRRPENLCR